MAWRHASRGTHTGGPLLGVPPTGKALAWSGTAALRLAGERIEANLRHGGLRISLWGVDRRREVAGLPPRLRLVGVG